MHGDLSGRQREDQPAASDIDVPILQDVAEELAVRLRVLAVDDGVGADDLHCAKIEDPEAFGPPGLLKSLDRNTGFEPFEPATFARGTLRELDGQKLGGRVTRSAHLLSADVDRVDPREVTNYLMLHETRCP